MAKIGSVAGFDTATFDLGVGSTIAGGVLTIVPSGPGNYDGGTVTKVSYDLAESSVLFRQNNSPGTTTDSGEIFLGMIDTHEFSWGFGSAQNVLGFYITGDAQTPGTGVWLQPVITAGGTDHSPSSAPFELAPVYLRIREASGTTYWEYSADGITWTVIYSVADPLSPTAMGALYFSNCVGYYNTSDVKVTQHFDNLNAGMAAPPTDSFFPFITA
jgi:hypothetical protein